MQKCWPLTVAIIFRETKRQPNFLKDFFRNSSVLIYAPDSAQLYMYLLPIPAAVLELSLTSVPGIHIASYTTLTYSVHFWLAY